MLEGLLDEPEACWVIAHICTHLPVYPTILADREAGSPMGSSGTYSHDCTNGKGSGNGRSLNRTIAMAMNAPPSDAPSGTTGMALSDE